MKRTMILLGCMSLGLAHAQQQGRAHVQHNGAQWRVGINTTKPVATMEISKADGIPATQVQGFLLPHLSQTERNAMEKEAMENGLMIFNTTKNCIDWWDGAHWQCTDGSYQDEHGDDFNPVKSFTGTYTHPVTTQNFTKNDCVAPQTGTTVSYTSQAITKTYVSNISQEDANEQAKQQALAEFNRLGQQYANATGKCASEYLTAPCVATTNGRYGIIRPFESTKERWYGVVNVPLDDESIALLESLAPGRYTYASEHYTTLSETGGGYIQIDPTPSIGYKPNIPIPIRTEKPADRVADMYIINWWLNNQEVPLREYTRRSTEDIKPSPRYPVVEICGGVFDKK